MERIPHPFTSLICNTPEGSDQAAAPTGEVQAEQDSGSPAAMADPNEGGSGTTTIS